MKPFLYVAMDFMERKEMMYWAERLSKTGRDFGFKINDDYLGKYTPQVAIPEIKTYGRKIFPDTKLYKGTRRMTNIVLELAELGGCEFTNVFALVGYDMLKKVVDSTKDSGIDIFALTVLTHQTDAHCCQMYRRSLEESVRMFTGIAKDAGCAGVILPGTCLSAVEDIAIKKLTPGFRPDWYVGSNPNPQSQKINVEQLVEGEVDDFTAGSVFFDTDDPVDSLNRTLDEVEEAYLAYCSKR